MGYKLAGGVPGWGGGVPGWGGGCQGGGGGVPGWGGWGKKQEYYKKKFSNQPTLRFFYFRKTSHLQKVVRDFYTFAKEKYCTGMDIVQYSR